MKKMLLFLLITPLLLTSCRHKTIPMIGMDTDGNEIVEQISAFHFKSQSAEVMNAVARDTLDILSKTEINNGWEMNEFQVGLLVNTSVGPLAWKVGATPGFRLVFKKIAK